MKSLLVAPLLSLAITPLSFIFSESAEAALIRRFVSTLDAGQEVTPSTSTATGFATLDLLETSPGVFALEYEVTVTPPLDFTDLRDFGTPSADDDIIFFHLHGAAPRGANGELPFNIRSIDTDGNLIADLDDDLVIDVAMDGTTTLSGRLEQDKGEFMATTSFPDFQSVVTELLSVSSGDTSLYWNIHSVQFPSGAIRGQVEAVPEPGSLLGLALLGGGLGVASLRRKLLTKPRLSSKG